eukprot:275799_1
MASQRILNELKDLEHDPLLYCAAGPIKDDITKWKASVCPQTGPYQKGIYFLNITFPEDYPFKPPHVTFETKIFHCNVSNDGVIGLDILYDDWSPTLTISKVLLTISALITSPSPNTNVQNVQVAQLFVKNRVKHDLTANKIAVQHANAPKQSKKVFQEQHKARVFRETHAIEKHVYESISSNKSIISERWIAALTMTEIKKKLYTAGGSLKCYDCDEPFYKQADYEEHMGEEHDNWRPYECERCDKTYTSKRNLVCHIECKHLNMVHYECDICHKTFYHKSMFSEHVRSHNNEKTFLCKLCGKYFKQLGGLSEHVRYVHTNNRRKRRHECDLCGKVFKRKCNLKTHKSMHSGDKPHVCGVCGRAFGRTSHLNRHRRIHTGEKPYNCNVCGKAFQYSNMKNAHQRKCKI